MTKTDRLVSLFDEGSLLLDHGTTQELCRLLVAERESRVPSPETIDRVCVGLAELAIDRRDDNTLFAGLTGEDEPEQINQPYCLLLSLLDIQRPTADWGYRALETHRDTPEALVKALRQMAAMEGEPDHATDKATAVNEATESLQAERNELLVEAAAVAGAVAEERKKTAALRAELVAVLAQGACDHAERVDGWFRPVGFHPGASHSIRLCELGEWESEERSEPFPATWFRPIESQDSRGSDE